MYLEYSSCSVARETVELQSLFIKVHAHYPTCSNPLSLQFPSLSLPIPSHFSSSFPFTLQLIPPFSSSSHFLFYFKPLTLSFPFFCLSPNPYFPVPFPFSPSSHCHSDMGIPLPKTLVIWASPVTLILIHIAKVIWEGDAHITRVLRMGMPKTQGCSYHCNTASFHPLLSWCIPFYFPAPSLFFILLFILLFSRFPPPTPHPPVSFFIS